jgi:hypothetical protein
VTAPEVKGGACPWCAGPVPIGSKTCSRTHKTKAKEKRRQIQDNFDNCPMPSQRKYLTEAAALAAIRPANRVTYHCDPGCFAWHLIKPCPNPGKVKYRSSHHAHQAQPGSKNAGMSTYRCVCDCWHWGHADKHRSTIGRALSRGTHVGFLLRARRPR